MLRGLIRDEQPKPHQPHENHIKANFHSHKMGSFDFPKTRKTSTTHYFHQRKNRNLNLFKNEHPSTSHWNLSHNHSGNKTGWSMTKNDYSDFKYGNASSTLRNNLKKGSLRQDPYHRSILEGFNKRDVTKIVAQGQLKDSSSLANTNFAQKKMAYKQQPATSRVDLLKSDIGIDRGVPSKVKKSHYGGFCESLNNKRTFPRLKPNSKPRTYNIITNKGRADRGLKHGGFEHYDQNRATGHHATSGNFSQAPPMK
jgi:hypothetical protein